MTNSRYRMVEQEYSPHVKSFPDYPGTASPWKGLDHSLGVILILSAAIGVPGNVLAGRFFSSRTRKDLVTSLYIVICIVDSLTCFVHLPSAIALLRGREPGAFNSHLFCVFWTIIYTILQKISIYLVLLLSVSRTIAIVRPFYKIRGDAIMFSIVIYVMALLIIPAFQYGIVSLQGEYKYSWDGAYCYYNFRLKFEHAINLILVGFPPIITFATFLISILKLHQSARVSAARQLSCMSASSKRSSTPEAQELGRYRASKTIAIFTGIFLVCNVPLFVNLMHNMTTRFFGVEYPGIYFSTRFMFWYSWHIAKMESVVVNAALNPILYYTRMARFRAWVNLILRCRTKQLDEFETYNPGGYAVGTASKDGRLTSHLSVAKRLFPRTSREESTVRLAGDHASLGGDSPRFNGRRGGDSPRANGNTPRAHAKVNGRLSEDPLEKLVLQRQGSANTQRTDC